MPNAPGHAQVDPWTGQHRNQIARAVADLRRIAVAYEQGREDLPDVVSHRKAQTVTGPGRAARRYAWELLRGDAQATRMQIQDVNAFLDCFDGVL